MFVGETGGHINYFENTGSTTAPTFTERFGVDNPLAGFDVGSDSNPSFVDIDNDGDLDAVVGGGNGRSGAV